MDSSAEVVTVVDSAAEVVTVLNASLYVGDLDSTVTEDDLTHIFNQVAPVLSVKVCRDSIDRHPVVYGYVNFKKADDAIKALKDLNFTPINGKPMRIMVPQADPGSWNRQANLFIKNLDRLAVDSRALYNIFSTFGTVLSCKVALDHGGISRGYGFVQFDSEESAQSAITELNGTSMNGKEVYVGIFVPREERVATPNFTNVYVKNLSESLDDEGLQALFSSFGTITSAVVMRDLDGNSRGFGFVNFQTPDSAAEAVEKMNGVTHDENVLFVGRAQKKVDREAELKAKFEQEKIRYIQLARSNLYFKNLDEDIIKNEENLRDLFSEFGTITSCKLMIAPNGVSHGSGFVAFTTPEEAAKAMKELHRKMIGRKPLFVGVAQRKEEREQILEATFKLLRAPPFLPYHQGPLGPLMPYHLQRQRGPPGPFMPPLAPLMPYHLQRQRGPPGPLMPPPGPLMPYHLQRQGGPPGPLMPPPGPLMPYHLEKQAGLPCQLLPYHRQREGRLPCQLLPYYLQRQELLGQLIDMHRGAQQPRQQQAPSMIRQVSQIPLQSTDTAVPESRNGIRGTGQLANAALSSAVDSSKP